MTGVMSARGRAMRNDTGPATCRSVELMLRSYVHGSEHGSTLGGPRLPTRRARRKIRQRTNECGFRIIANQNKKKNSNFQLQSHDGFERGQDTRTCHTDRTTIWRRPAQESRGLRSRSDPTCDLGPCTCFPFYKID